MGLGDVVVTAIRIKDGYIWPGTPQAIYPGSCPLTSSHGADDQHMAFGVFFPRRQQGYSAGLIGPRIANFRQHAPGTDGYPVSLILGPCQRQGMGLPCNTIWSYPRDRRRAYVSWGNYQHDSLSAAT